MEFFVPPRQHALLSENTSAASSRTRQVPSALDSPSSTDKLSHSHSVKTAASRRHRKMQGCAMDLVGQEKLAQAARTFTERHSGLTRHSWT